MQTIVDLDLREVVSDFTVKSPAPPYTGKSQDTQSHEIYFVQGGVIKDLGTGPAIKFGLIGPGGPSLLVLQTSYTRQVDASGDVFYLGYPIFNTSNLAAALGSNTSIACIAEIRYQLTTGEIEHTLDIPTTIFRTILSEITSDTTTAAFTTPAVGSNVTIAIGSTTWLQINQQITIATAGIYQVISITDGTHFVAQNTGQPGNATSGTVIASGSAVAGAPVNALTTYPPSNTLELISTRDVASGHAGLDAGTHLNPAVIPVDNVTIQILDGQVASSFILAETAASFVTPAANATVNVTLVSSTGLVVGQYVRLPIAGYYIVESIPDGTHAVLQNNGDPFNVASGVTVPTDTPLLPAQAAAGGGSGTPGQNAYTLTSASFTVPSVGSTVSVAMGATSWLGGSGYYVFITGAGYYAVSSITDGTHAVLTNAGGTSNAPPGTVVPTNTQVAASGLPGPTGASGAGLAAYDALAASFTMPAVSGTVTITIGNTAWLSANQIIYIATAGYLQVSAISSATQVLVINLNYPGNATATTVIASGSRVSPGGLQGPQGAGGPGLNAFTTLSANFIQPAIGSNVTVNVGSTTWMAAGQGIFIQGGGYYTIQSISDVTHAIVTNLGGSANVAAGSTVTGNGTQNVAPAGIPGVPGTSAHTTTTASFSMPTSGATVTVTVGATSWMAQGQVLYIPSAGYFSVSVITDATHVVLTNLGYAGNATSGTTVASGSSVAAAGLQGPAGSGGGGGGGVSSLTDAQTSSGVTLIYNASGVLNRLVPGSGIAFDTTTTPGGVTINASGGGGGGVNMADPENGIQWTDDFIPPTAPFSSGGTLFLPWILAGQGTTGLQGASGITVGQSGSEMSVADLYTASVTGIADLTLGLTAAGSNYCVPIGLGIATWKCKIAIDAIITSTDALVNQVGIFRYNTTALYGGFFFEYDYTQSANWRCCVRTGTGTTNVTYADSGIAVTANNWFKLKVVTNATWTSFAFYVNNTLVQTITTNVPTFGTDIGLAPHFLQKRSAFAAARHIYLGYFYLNYPFSN